MAGHEVAISNPGKVFFPRTGHTKLDLVRYYLSVADGALRGVTGRPMVLKRFVNGADGEAFFQKRAPESRPPWIDTVELRFPSGRSAVEVVPRDAATLAWAVNLGCIDLNPHPVRAGDLDHPDELRVNLDPGAGRRMAADPPGGAGRPRGAGRLRAGQLAQDVRLAWLPRLRQDRAPLGLRPGPPCGGGPGPRGRAPRTGPGHREVVEGRTARRVRGLQPEREGPDRGLGVLGTAYPGRPRLDAAELGRGSRVPPGGVHH